MPSLGKFRKKMGRKLMDGMLSMGNRSAERKGIPNRELEIESNWNSELSGCKMFIKYF